MASGREMIHVVCLPKELSEADQKEFQDFVDKGGEVDSKTLPELCKAAHSVCLVRLSARVAATGAIQNPNTSHRDEVKEGAEFPELDQYGRELGWIQVHEDLRRMGLAKFVTRFLLKSYKDPLWATTRGDNFAMHKILWDSGFFRAGKSFDSKTPNATLLLWIREKHAK